VNAHFDTNSFIAMFVLSKKGQRSWTNGKQILLHMFRERTDEMVERTDSNVGFSVFDPNGQLVGGCGRLRTARESTCGGQDTAIGASQNSTQSPVPATPPHSTTLEPMVVDAASAQGAAVTFPLIAASEACSPKSGSNFPIGTTTVHCPDGDFSIIVRGADAQANILAGFVTGFAEEGRLRAYLINVENAAAAGQKVAACASLHAFTQQVERQMGHGHTVDAKELLRGAARIGAVLGCTSDRAR
jgi:hypothetical protein